MNNQKIIEKIKKAAQRDEKHRKDIRYKRAMAFLTQKGFLKTNIKFDDYYQAKLKINELIWAGKKVEPRILEVLPAAVARLPKAFILDTARETLELQMVVEDLKNKKVVGHDFLNMPYEKVRVWMEISLNDKRTKTASNKKKMVTFRLSQQTIAQIKELANKAGLSNADLIHSLVKEKFGVPKGI